MRKRSKYRPKGVNPLAHVAVVLGTQQMDRSDALVFAERVALAVEDISKGKHDRDLWQHIFDAVNMVEQWVVHGVALDEDHFIAEAQATMLLVLERRLHTGVMGVRAEELAVMRRFAAMYAELVAGVTNREFYDADQRSRAYMRNVLAMKEPA